MSASVQHAFTVGRSGLFLTWAASEALQVVFTETKAPFKASEVRLLSAELGQPHKDSDTTRMKFYITWIFLHIIATITKKVSD